MILIHRTIADDSIVVIPSISPIDAHNKLTTASNMVDGDFYLVGALSQGIIIRGDFQAQYL